MILKNKNSKTKKIIALSLVAVILIGGTVFAYRAQQANKEATEKQISQHEQNKYVSGGVNYSPPSAEDEAMNAEQEAKNKEREQLDQQAAATTADVTISSADQANSVIEIRAYISNLLEEGGTCTATFTKSGAPTVTTTSTAFKDAKTIQCGALDTPRSKFSTSGQWSVVVSYKSSQASGSSKTATVGIN